MAATRPSFASLGLAPLLLRLVLGFTFLWTGLGKWYGTATVQGEDAALLANLDIIPRSSPAAPAPNAPAKPLAPSTTSSPAPASGPSSQAPSASPGILLLAQSSSAAPAKTVPITAGPPLSTAADFPEPVSCRAMWRIAILIRRAAHPAPATPLVATSPTPQSAAAPLPVPIWPAVLAEGLWPKILAIAVFVSELGAGVCLLIGFFTRFAASCTAGVMLGAIWLTQIGPAIQSGNALLGFLPAHDIWNPQPWMPLAWQFSLLGASLALMCLGCGVLAIDRAISGYRAVPERFQRSATPGAPSGPAR